MDFLSLSLDERAEILWQDGTFIASTEYYNQKVALYTMQGKYVELWIDGNNITDIKLLENSKLFRGYFNQN